MTDLILGTGHTPAWVAGPHFGDDLLRNRSVSLTFDIYAKNSVQPWRLAKAAPPLGTVVAPTIEEARVKAASLFHVPIALDLRRDRR